MLLRTTTSIDDAKKFCKTFLVSVQSGAVAKQMEFRIDELGLEELFEKEIKSDARNERYREIFQLLKDEKVNTVTEIVQGMHDEIQGTYDFQGRSKPLADLNLKLFEENE